MCYKLRPMSHPAASRLAHDLSSSVTSAGFCAEKSNRCLVEREENPPETCCGGHCETQCNRDLGIGSFMCRIEICVRFGVFNMASKSCAQPKIGSTCWCFEKYHGREPSTFHICAALASVCRCPVPVVAARRCLWSGPWCPRLAMP